MYFVQIVTRKSISPYSNRVWQQFISFCLSSTTLFSHFLYGVGKIIFCFVFFPPHFNSNSMPLQMKKSFRFLINKHEMIHIGKVESKNTSFNKLLFNSLQSNVESAMISKSVSNSSPDCLKLNFLFIFKSCLSLFSIRYYESFKNSDFLINKNHQF
jgi:hypothetical protein